MKKMKILVLIITIFALLAGCVAYYMFKQPTVMWTRIENKGENIENDINSGNLIGEFQTKEEAEKIADTYGLKLLDYQYDIALFYTEEDPLLIIQKSNKKGKQILYLNTQVSIMGEKE